MTCVFKALANENRLNILKWLRHPKKHFTSQHCDVEKDGVCVGLIEQKTGLSQSTVSQYLMVLQQAGLVSMERRGQWTFCKRNPKTLQELAQLIGQEL